MVFLTVADYEKAMRHSIFNQQFDQYAGIKLVSNYAGIVRQPVILARGTQIQRALAHPAGNKQAAADLLGIGIATFYRKLKEA